jgi:hypothetical protein
MKYEEISLCTGTIAFYFNPLSLVILHVLPVLTDWISAFCPQSVFVCFV